MHKLFAEGFSFALQTMKELLKPTADWGPALDEFRTGRYSSRPAKVLDDDEVQVVSTTSESAIPGATPWNHLAPQPGLVHISTEYSQL